MPDSIFEKGPNGEYKGVTMRDPNQPIENNARVIPGLSPLQLLAGTAMIVGALAVNCRAQVDRVLEGPASADSTEEGSK